MQIMKGKKSWRDIITYAVFTLCATLAGAFIYVGIKKNRAAAPRRVENSKLGREELIPSFERLMNKYPEKDILIVADIADRDDAGKLIAPTRVSVMSLRPSSHPLLSMTRENENLSVARYEPS